MEHSLPGLQGCSPVEMGMAMPKEGEESWPFTHTVCCNSSPSPRAPSHSYPALPS